jgi:hypothetical protein
MLSFKQLMERVNETRSFYLEEEVEELDESNENFDSNSKAHQAAKKATKGWTAKHSKATYHPDGTATITTHGKLADDPHGKSGDISKQIETKSHHVVNLHLKGAGGSHGMTADETHGHKEKLNGVNWKVKEKSKPSYFKAGSHEIHLSEEVEGLDELKRETVRTYYNKAIAQGKPIADKMKVGGGDWSKDGQDTKTLKKRAAGVTMALKRRRGEVKMSEDAEQTDEALKGSQHKIDANKNGKVDGHDFKILRNQKKARYQ